MNWLTRLLIKLGWMPAPPVRILGCTDPKALNYNPKATDNDGTCQYAPPPVVPPPPPKPEYDINGLNFGAAVPLGDLRGLNCARAFKTNLKSDENYWYQDAGAVHELGNFTVLRNGGTVTMGQRFDFAYKGNGYAKSVGTWPAIYRKEKRIGQPPSLSEFISDAELKQDAREPDNYHVNLKEALSATDTKLLYVANPFQDADELRAVIQYFGPDKFVGIVAGNELNSPKAFRYGIRAEDVAYWAGTLRPVCEEYGIKLGVGLPPYEYRDKELKGEALNGKLAADKTFAEALVAHKALFDFVCIHPYGQVPDKAQGDPVAPWVNLAASTMPKDYDFLKVQLAHYYAMFGLPFYLDEHGLENPEYGHVNSRFAVRWHYERLISMINLNREFSILGSCWQVLLAELQNGQPQSLIYESADGFAAANEIKAFEYGTHIDTRHVDIRGKQSEELLGLIYAMCGPDLLFINDSTNHYTTNKHIVSAGLFPLEETSAINFTVTQDVPPQSMGVILDI